MHWTISKQIFAGYAISLLFLLLLGGSTYQVSKKMMTAFEERRQAYVIGNKADQLLSLVQDAETGQRGFLLTGQDSYLDPYNDAVKDLPQALADFKKLTASTSHADLMLDLQSKVQDKLDELQQTIDLRRNKGAEAALAVVQGHQGKAAMDRIREILGKISDDQEQEQEDTGRQAEAAAADMKLVIVLGVPFAAIVMLIAGLLTARQISQPMSHMAGAARQIASGNLNVEMPRLSKAEEVQALGSAFSSMVAALGQSARLSERLASGDLTVQITPLSEADVVGKSQADMVAKLSDLIEQVQRSGVQVNSSAVELAATSKQQQSTAGEMASTTTEISSTAKEMSATSTELLKAADNVNAISQQLAGLATGGKDGLARMELVMKQVIEASSSITSRLGEMNDKAGNIGSVVTTITKIADQTNLLSLNAAIEAEKAGEYGRGFAVVAAEIRRLADQTAASTLDIEQMVREMLGSVSAGVMGMDKFSEEVRRSAREVSEVSGRIDQMIEQVQSLAPSVESVYEGMRAQTQGSTQISDALSQLGDAARQTSDAVRDSNRAVEQLNEAARGLHTAISRFKLR